MRSRHTSRRECLFHKVHKSPKQGTYRYLQLWDDRHCIWWEKYHLWELKHFSQRWVHSPYLLWSPRDLWYRLSSSYWSLSETWWHSIVLELKLNEAWNDACSSGTRGLDEWPRGSGTVGGWVVVGFPRGGRWRRICETAWVTRAGLGLGNSGSTKTYIHNCMLGMATWRGVCRTILRVLVIVLLLHIVVYAMRWVQRQVPKSQTPGFNS